MILAERSLEMRDFFNEKAEGYDNVHLPMMANKTAITRLLPENTEKVLDLGAGTGLELIPLFERFPDACVTVADISEDMLAELKKRPFADKVDILCGDFFEMEFGHGYDAVISSAALHHFTEADKADLYSKIFACLRPGGVFINSDRYAVDQAEQDEIFRLYEENTHGYRHWDTPLTVNNEAKLLLRSGFESFRSHALEDRNYVVMTAQKPSEAKIDN